MRKSRIFYFRTKRIILIVSTSGNLQVVRLIVAESRFTFENKILNMKSISHELDLKFQKTAIIMAVLSVFIITLNVDNAVAIPLLRSSFFSTGLATFVALNLLFVFTRPFIRYYLGTQLVESLYASFLVAGLIALTYFIAKTLNTVIF